MAGILAKIAALRPSLPEAEGQVADYIAGKPEKAGFESISGLANSADVSVASVSRLSKKLGYANYKALRQDLAEEIIPDENLGAMFKPINSSDDEKQITEKVFSGNIKSLEDTFKMLDVTELTKAAVRIAGAKRVVLFGIGSSGHISKDAALRFALLDIQAESYSDPQEMIAQSLRLDKDGVALGISHSGRSRMTVESLRIAQECGATTIGISNYLQSPLHQYSEIYFCTSFAEHKVKVAALSARIAQMCLLDALYLLTAKNRKAFKKTELINRYAEDLLRF
ncbi:MAG: MurR/RpiR family transcriptional regulator [Sedimentisphaerales bacterium]|nr:MurR/RpiR family transcriptional regulator [Sedimentisphaerales bacterium]